MAFFSSSPTSHLSGRHLSASSPYNHFSRWTVHGLYPHHSVSIVFPISAVSVNTYHGDPRLRWNRKPINLQPFLAHNALDREANGRMQPRRLVYAGLQIWQCLRLLPRYEFGDAACLCGGVDFGAEGREGGGVLEEVVEEGAFEDTGCVDAGLDVRVCPGGDRAVVASVVGYKGKNMWTCSPRR